MLFIVIACLVAEGQVVQARVERFAVLFDNGNSEVVKRQFLVFVRDKIVLRPFFFASEADLDVLSKVVFGDGFCHVEIDIARTVVVALAVDAHKIRAFFLRQALKGFVLGIDPILIILVIGNGHAGHAAEVGQFITGGIGIGIVDAVDNRILDAVRGDLEIIMP